MKIKLVMNGLYCDAARVSAYAECVSALLPSRILPVFGDEIDDFEAFPAAVLINQPEETLRKLLKNVGLSAKFSVFFKTFSPFLTMVSPVNFGTEAVFSSEDGARVFTEKLVTRELEAERFLRCAFDYAAENELQTEIADFASLLKTDVFFRRCVAEVIADYPSLKFDALLAGDVVRHIERGDNKLIVAGKIAAELFLSLYEDRPHYDFFCGETPFSAFVLNTVNLDEKTELFVVFSAINELLTTSFNFKEIRGKLDRVLTENVYNSNENYFDRVIADVKSLRSR